MLRAGSLHQNRSPSTPSREGTDLKGSCGEETLSLSAGSYLGRGHEAQGRVVGWPTVRGSWVEKVAGTQGRGVVNGLALG